MQLTIFDLVVLLSFIHGFISAIVIFRSRGQFYGKELFATVICVLALLSGKILVHTLGLWSMPNFRYFPLAIDTLLPTLLYLYALKVTNAKPRFKLWVYFIPTILFMTHGLVVYLSTVSLASLALKDSIANALHFNSFKMAEDITSVILSVIYWILGYRRISMYRKWLFSTQTDDRLQELTWLKNLLLATGVLVLALILMMAVEDVWHLRLFYCYLAVLIYYLSIKGFRLYAPSFQSISPIAIEIESNSETKLDISPSTNLTLQEIEIIKLRIITALETDQLFLNAELSLKNFATHLSIPAAEVSAAINLGFGVNFRSLVSRYRVEEVKRRLSDPPAHLSLYGIALECGFNSEASFYRIFRQFTGESPASYLGKKNNKK